MKRYIYLLLGIGGLLGAALACNPVGGGGQAATAEALALSIEQTATAAAEANINAEALVQTAQAEATARSQQIDATLAAQEAQAGEAAAATATAIAPILAELPTYGVDPSEGQPGWIHPPLTLDVEGYLQYDYANYFIGTLVSDFVVAADITWDTTTGLAGCGFVLRSDGNEDAINEYMVIASRGGNGTVFFITQTNGSFFRQQNIPAGRVDPAFEWQNNTTNRIAVVARGDTFTLYTNGTRIGEVTDSTYNRGFVAMVALSESGRTVCEFDNAWLWSLD